MDGLESLCKGQPPQGFLEDLKELDVNDCKKLQVLFKMDEHREEKQDQPLSNLKSLKLTELPELRWILRGSAHSFTFRSLKVVEIDYCNKLEWLFSPSLIQSLAFLEELKIESCPKLKTLFGEPKNDGEVESESYSSRPLCLSKLKTLQIRLCSKLEYVVPVTLAQGLPYLESVSVYKCGELETLFEEPENDGEVESESASSRPLCLPKLKTLEIRECSKLEYVVRITLAEGLLAFELVSVYESVPVMLIPHLPQLSILKIKSCQNLNQIIANDDISESSSSQGPQLEKKMIFPRLKEIVLENLSRVKSFNPVGYHLEFTCLELLDVNWTKHT